MARIAESELERLKVEVAVARLVEAAGIALSKRGNDLVGRCPFHEDGTPSLTVTMEEIDAEVKAACSERGRAGGH